jgi:hypothetical protein
VAHMMIKSCLMHSFRSSGSILDFVWNGIRLRRGSVGQFVDAAIKGCFVVMLLWSHGRVARLVALFPV